MQHTPEEIPAAVLGRCPTCGLPRSGITKQPPKPVPETPQSTPNLKYINVRSSSGKIDAKDSTAVRTHVMRNLQKRRQTRNQTLSIRALRPHNICMCRSISTPGNVVTPQVQSILGAGRCDPFLRLQTESVPKRYHELVDYSKELLSSSSIRIFLRPNQGTSCA